MSITLPVPKYVHVITKVAVDSIEVQEELQYPAIIDQEPAQPLVELGECRGSKVIEHSPSNSKGYD